MAIAFEYTGLSQNLSALNRRKKYIYISISHAFGPNQKGTELMQEKLQLLKYDERQLNDLH